MTNKSAFKIIFTIVYTALFGYLAYLLVNSIKTGLFFTDADTVEITLLGVAMGGIPILLSVVCSMIRKRPLGLLSLVNMLFWVIVGAAMGEETNAGHVAVYAGMILIPYILCLKMIWGQKEKQKPSEPYVSRQGGSASSSGGYRAAGRSMSFAEKDAYIVKNNYGAYTPEGMKKIDNDPNLTPAQKEELKNHMKYFGD